jgi:hypothetical protein
VRDRANTGTPSARSGLPMYSGTARATLSRQKPAGSGSWSALGARAPEEGPAIAGVFLGSAVGSVGGVAACPFFHPWEAFSGARSAVGADAQYSRLTCSGRGRGRRRMACGNNSISRDYLASQPAGSGGTPVSPRPRGEPQRTIRSDTSLDSPDRDWGQTGSHKYGGKVEERGAHIYFGGLHKPDGRGHGHGFLDADGNFTVFRDPWDPATGRAGRRAATHEYVPVVRRRF